MMQETLYCQMGGFELAEGTGFEPGGFRPVYWFSGPAADQSATTFQKQLVDHTGLEPVLQRCKRYVLPLTLMALKW